MNDAVQAAKEEDDIAKGKQTKLSFLGMEVCSVFSLRLKCVPWNCLILNCSIFSCIFSVEKACCRDLF